ncbi:MAG: hypothetical protein SWY16_09110 [Cyanobacteriota bacterium]|nr:hypothetical protein [Cyanobacteriota bacterium]
MAGTFEIIQWCLAILTGIFAIVGMVVAVTDGAIGPVILFSLALAIVLPPLQPFIDEKLPFLKPKPLKLFLCILLAAIAPLSLGNILSNLGEVRLCALPESGRCIEDIRMFPRNTSTLYLSATPGNIADGTAVNLELTYAPEPGEFSSVSTQTSTLQVQNETAQIELPIEALNIGTYVLKLGSQTDRFSTVELEFTVWDSSETIDDLQSLEPSTAKLDNLQICDRLEEPLDIDFEVIECQEDKSVFPSRMKAAIAYLDLQSEEGEEKPIQVSFIWRYLPQTGEAVEVRETKSIDNPVGSISYILASEDGFAQGNYELMIYLEAQNARPIFRSFSVNE